MPKGTKNNRRFTSIFSSWVIDELFKAYVDFTTSIQNYNKTKKTGHIVILETVGKTSSGGQI